MRTRVGDARTALTGATTACRVLAGVARSCLESGEATAAQEAARQPREAERHEADRLFTEMGATGRARQLLEDGREMWRNWAAGCADTLIYVIDMSEASRKKWQRSPLISGGAEHEDGGVR